MEITCFSCQQTWQVPAGQLLAARLRFGFGAADHTFTCPNCDAKNVVTEREFVSSEHASHLIPVTGSQPGMDTHPPDVYAARGSAPTNPVPGPGEPAKPIHAVVRERGVSLQRDHHWTAETMGKLSKGEQITILDTWTNGEETWVQLGPERWARIEEDGETLIELLDD